MWTNETQVNQVHHVDTLWHFLTRHLFPTLNCLCGQLQKLGSQTWSPLFIVTQARAQNFSVVLENRNFVRSKLTHLCWALKSVKDKTVWIWGFDLCLRIKKFALLWLCVYDFCSVTSPSSKSRTNSNTSLCLCCFTQGWKNSWQLFIKFGTQLDLSSFIEV